MSISMLTSIQDLNRRCNLDDSFDPLDMSGGVSQPPAASTKHEKKKTQGQPAAKYLLQKRTAAKTVPEPGEKVTVRSNVAKTLKKLFSSSSSSSASGVPWSAFLGIMTGLGFSAKPVAGSVYRFQHDAWGSINIHQPHPGDRFEGVAALRLRGRLKRRFGWDRDTFVVEKK